MDRSVTKCSLFEALKVLLKYLTSIAFFIKI